MQRWQNRLAVFGNVDLDDDELLRWYQQFPHTEDDLQALVVAENDPSPTPY